MTPTSRVARGARIGVVGTGRLGRAICARLVACGWSVIATDIRPELRRSVRDLGARWVPSVAELGGAVSTIITVLPGREQVLGVRDGLEGQLGPGVTWIDMSSAAPGTARDVSELIAGTGARWLDAPVSGDPEAALHGCLTAYVGGCGESLARQRGLLSDLTTEVLHMGAAGRGYLTKLLVNLLWFANALIGAEVLGLADRSGLDLDAVRGAIDRGPGASFFMTHHAPLLLKGEVMDSFSIARCAEEIHDVLHHATELEVPMVLADRVASVYGQAVERYGDADGELLAARMLLQRAGAEFGSGVGDEPEPRNR